MINENYFIPLIVKRGNVCENCGLTIHDVNKKNCAHIIPKSIFKSVALNIDNGLLLCTTFDRNDGKTGCHETYDNSWEKARQMNVWPLAKKRFKLFSHSIKEMHKILFNFED